jgi:1L-myo-inositol 1-phosphate cytidylyltransferase / CDP-L-myo-inositol myo-inositolphosphotransferase
MRRPGARRPGRPGDVGVAGLSTATVNAAGGVEGVLVILPPTRGADRAIGSLPVAGLPLIRRLVLTATAAGYARVLVDAGVAVADGGLAGTSAEGLEAAPGLRATSRQRVVIVPVNLLAQRRWLRGLLETTLQPERLYVDPSPAAVVETERVGVVIAAARGAGAAEVVDRLRTTFAPTPLAPDPGGALALTSAGDAARAETWLLRSLIKQNEGFMSRHLERRISLAITRRLVGTRVTPNAMTLVSVAIGLGAAPFFLSGAPPWQLVGALLFLAHSILDGCDGELARLKFLESRRGAVLDFWGDNIVHVAVFSAIAVGWAVRAASGWPLVLGAIAVASTLGTAALMFRRFAEDRVAIGTWAARLIGALSHRDFIYVVVLLSAFGRAHWFLVAAAVGTPAFLALALVVLRSDGRVS